MLVESQDDSAAIQMDDLFGAPPLIKGEDAARYWRLHAAITHAIKPETIFDKIHVREYTDKLWQQQRCKQSAASLIEGAYIEALASLLRPFNSPNVAVETMFMHEDAASKMARDYYSGEAKGKQMEAIELRLAQYSITNAQILAKAMQLCGGSISMINRMEASCETSLRVLRKENDRRPAVENPKARGSDQPADEAIR